MKKTVTINKFPLPKDVDIDSANWYYSTRADFSDEALPTETESDDIYIKEFEYDFYEDTKLYVRAELNASNDKKYTTNIIVITKHYKKVLVNNFVYAPLVNVTLRADLGGAMVNINRPIFYFETDEHISTSYLVTDTNGNIIYRRMYDKDNLYDVNIPLPLNLDFEALIFSVRYEFKDVVEEVWGRKVIVFNDSRFEITLSKNEIYKGERSKISVLNSGYYNGTLYYYIETMTGDIIKEETKYEDGVYIENDIISNLTYINVVLLAIDSINGIEEVRVKVKVLSERLEYVRELSPSPQIVEVDGISPETMNQSHIENSYFLEKNSDDYIDIYKLTDDGATLKAEDVYYLDKYDNGFSVFYVSDIQILVSYINGDDEMVLVHMNDISDLTKIDEYKIPSNSKISISKKKVYYKEDDKAKILNLNDGVTVEEDVDYSAIDNPTHISKINDAFFVFNKDGEFYHSEDTDNIIDYSDKSVDILFVYPIPNGVNIVYNIKDDKKIYIKFYNQDLKELKTLKDIDTDGDKYSVLYDLRKEQIQLMKG